MAFVEDARSLLKDPLQTIDGVSQPSHGVGRFVLPGPALRPSEAAPEIGPAHSAASFMGSNALRRASSPASAMRSRFNAM